MANSAAARLLSTALGRPALQLGALDVDAIPVVIIVLSVLLLLTSLLRRVLEDETSSRSAFTLLRHQIEDTDNSSTAKAHKRKSLRRKKNRSAVKLVPSSFPSHLLPSASQIDCVEVANVDVEANAGLATRVLDTTSECESGGAGCDGARLACSVPIAVGLERRLPRNVGEGMPEEAAEDGQDVHTPDVTEPDAHCETLLQAERGDQGMGPGVYTEAASCSCDDDGTWACGYHMIYGKRLLLAHLAINRRIAQGPPGLQRKHHTPSRIVLPSTVALPRGTQSVKGRDVDAKEGYPKSSMAPRRRVDRCS